jgi:hypothetical protein
MKIFAVMLKVHISTIFFILNNEGKYMFKKFEVQQLSLSFGGLGVTLGKKNNELKQEILRELFVIRHILSDFYFRYEAWDDYLINEEQDDEIRLERIAHNLFGNVFNIYLDLSKIILGSKYFVLLTKEKRNTISEIFDYITSERVSMEELEDHYLDPSEQVELVNGLNSLFLQIDKEIELIVETID